MTGHEVVHCEDEATCDVNVAHTKRPPVIGQESVGDSGHEQPLSSPHSLHSSRPNQARFMHSDWINSKPIAAPGTIPPALPPKPKGHHTTAARGPPPPLLPRTSSLSACDGDGAVRDDDVQNVPSDLMKSSSAGCEAVKTCVSVPSLPLDSKDVVSTVSRSGGGAHGCGGSESSRGFEPEGSADLSPSYSESIGSGNTPPPYVKWRDNMAYLLEDEAGTHLFMQYLKEQQLDHYLLFILICKGFKSSQLDEKKTEKTVESVYKRYINPTSRKHLGLRIDCIDEHTKKSIESKLKSHSGIDQNIFDGATSLVLEHMAAKFYPNFLTSEIFVDHVRAMQQHYESDCRLSTVSSVSGSRPGQLSKTLEPHVGDDSGISGITEDNKPASSATEAPDPSLMSHQAGSPPRLDSLKMSAAVLVTSHQMLPTVDEDRELKLDTCDNHVKNMSASSAAAAMAGGTVLSLATTQGASTATSKPSSMVTLAATGNFPPSTSAAATLSRSHWTRGNEVHPNVMSPSGGSAVPPITSASYAYHANSSNWNPVSRQDSELQSQSSGAVGGDTTDDNYSTFTMDSSQNTYKANKKHLERKMRHLEQQRIERASQQLKEDPSQLLPRPKGSRVLAGGPGHGHGHHGAGAFSASGVTPNPEKQFAEFAELLISKLMAYQQKQCQREELDAFGKSLGHITDADSAVSASAPSSAPPPFSAEQLRRGGQHHLAPDAHHSRPRTAGGGAVVDLADVESDQSILDDHVNRIWSPDSPDQRRTPPIHDTMIKYNSRNTSSLFDTSSRSVHQKKGNNLSSCSMSGHNTLPGRSRANASFGAPNQVMGLQQTYHHHHPHQKQQQQPANFRTGGNGNLYYSAAPQSMAGDLAFESGVNKSLHELNFSVKHRVSGAQYQSTSRPGPMPYTEQSSNRVLNWVKDVNNASSSSIEAPFFAGYQGSSNQGMSNAPRTAAPGQAASSDGPRCGARLHPAPSTSSASGHGGSGTRAKSQDRSGSSGIFYSAIPAAQNFANGSYGLGVAHHDASHVVSEASRRLQQQQYHQRRAAPNSSSNNNTSMMMMSSSSSNYTLAAGNTSLPASAMDVVDFTTAVYKFTQEKDDTPYRVKIPGRNLTLHDVKRYLPRKGQFRFYFKTKIDDTPFLAEETNEQALVPLWDGMVIVQCSHD